MIISKVQITKFRKFHDVEFDLGEKLTVIAGQNGTMKTTLLGMIGQPFSMEGSTNPMNGQKTIDGRKFESKFKDNFKLSIIKEKPGDHLWKLVLTDCSIHPKGFFEAESIIRKQGNRPEELRIWSTEGREKDMGYVQCPVIYLSLKRLSPIGEEKRVQITDIALSDEEKEFYLKYHNRILLLDLKLEAVEQVRSSNKNTLGVRTAEYDSLTNSAGQDNVGKILMAVLSFKRLKDSFPNDYKGGILLIDELDATMFPRAQEALIECLYRFASDFSLQIVFTTHSTRILRKVLAKEYSQDTVLLYLRMRKDGVLIDKNPIYESVVADLNVSVVAGKSGPIISVYSEDEVSNLILNKIIPNSCKEKILRMTGVSISCNTYCELVKKKVPEFCNSIIVLDGDCSSIKLKSNFCVLPGKGMCPEKMFFQFLQGLDDKDEFWGEPLGGYNQQVCFANFLGQSSMRTEDYKKWFKEQKSAGYWGRGCCHLLNRWKKAYVKEITEFQASFAKALGAAMRNKYRD